MFKLTLVELQEKLGKEIDILTDSTTSYAVKLDHTKISSVIAVLAKQMINNADVILRTEKLANEGKLNNSQVIKMISKENE